MKAKFLEWFSQQIYLGLEYGHEFDDIKIDHKLTDLTPFDGKQLIEFTTKY